MNDKTEWVYNRPKHGWVCFFCGDTFRTPGAAEDHFGGTMGSTAACRIKFGDEMGLLMGLRKTEKRVRELEAQIANEDTPKDRELARIRSEHSDALKREEEAGFARGIADMRKHGWRLRRG
jgi:hypothetical protein